MPPPDNPVSPPVDLDSVLRTEELTRRSPRPPDYAAEAAALKALARTLAEAPRTLLQTLVELVVKLCRADSAGISILEPNGSNGHFRWRAVAGAWAPHVGHCLPRDSSPCGVVVDRNHPLLFVYPERCFPAPMGADLPIVEGLLVPFHAGGQPIGTVWAVAHFPERSFDPEDVRLITSLSQFAAAAHQTVAALDAAEANQAELRRRVAEQDRTEAELRARTQELKTTTQQLWRSARLAGVGELAAGLAHELNNPLATVSLRIEGLLARTPPDDPRRRSLEVVEREVTRMARLVSHLLSFTRAGIEAVAAVDVTKEIELAVELTEPHRRAHGVWVVTRFNSGVPPVLADRLQFRQVLLSLLTNGVDAMPGGGRLAIQVGLGKLPGGQPGVTIAVTDTGPGLPPDLMTQMADPLLAAPSNSGEAGLGLAVTKRLIQEHGGTLEVQSQPGVGTTILVTLAAAAEAIPPKNHPGPSEESRPTPDC